jgi:hexosaminidase
VPRPSLLPAPVSVRAGAGPPVLLCGPVAIAAAEGLGGEARWLRRLLEAATGWQVEVVGLDDPAAVVLARGAAADAGEGYRLEIRDGRVRVTGEGPAGVFYGLQTLRQLLPDALLRRATVGAAAAAPVDLGPLVVEDRPRLSWRGVHLDVCRHFMPKAFLLKLVDLAAFHKLNRLHLHLTDDQGWRVPVDRHPRLVEVGAWRRRSPVGHARDHRFDDVPHGGFYSKDDLREVVAYAAERHVTVVPEVEMPGHTAAAIASYPELGNTGRPLEVGTRWGVYTEVLNLEASTISFFADVIDEVCDLFPGPWFHVGGDECPTDEWERSPRAREVMAAHGLTSARQLQGWFTSQVAARLAARGRRLVGWDEILEAGAPPDAVVMSWRGLERGVEAATLGHDVVMVPEEWLYFDWAHSEDRAEPLAIRGATPLEKVHGFDPVPDRVPADRRRHVLGAQCQLWTEYVATPEHAEYQYFPRLCALAETVWSPRDAARPPPYAEFERRLARHLARLDAIGVNYRPLDGPTPGQARTWRGPPGPPAGRAPRGG